MSGKGSAMKKWGNINTNLTIDVPELSDSSFQKSYVTALLGLSKRTYIIISGKTVKRPSK